MIPPPAAPQLSTGPSSAEPPRAAGDTVLVDVVVRGEDEAMTVAAMTG